MKGINIIILCGNLIGMFYVIGIGNKLKYLLPLPCILSYTFILVKVWKRILIEIWYFSENIATKTDLYIVILSILTFYFKWFFYFIKRNSLRKLLSRLIRTYEANGKNTKTIRTDILKILFRLNVMLLWPMFDFLFIEGWEAPLEYYLIYFYCVVFTQFEQIIIDLILNVILEFQKNTNEILLAFNWSLGEDFHKFHEVRRNRKIFENEAKKLKSRYNFLWTLSLDSNELFGFQQLFTLMLTICFIISNVYALMMIIIVQYDILTGMVGLVWCSYLFSTVYYLLRGWCYLKCEVRVIYSIKLNH